MKLESYEQANLMHPDLNSISFPPSNAHKSFHAVFMSPPWGGTGYNLLDEYTLDNIYPDFDKIIEKATEYSPNLMIFLPRSTSIPDLVRRLSKFQNKLVADSRRS